MPKTQTKQRPAEKNTVQLCENMRNKKPGTFTRRHLRRTNWWRLQENTHESDEGMRCRWSEVEQHRWGEINGKTPETLRADGLEDTLEGGKGWRRRCRAQCEGRTGEDSKETGGEITQEEEMKGNTQHMRATFQSKTGNDMITTCDRQADAHLCLIRWTMIAFQLAGNHSVSSST